MHQIFNLQRKMKISRKDFAPFLAQIFDSVEETDSKSAVIVFVSDRQMREMNRQFRGKDSTTDVLSFPFTPDVYETDEKQLGDIAISLEQAQKQAAENNLSLELEIKQLILHGILHLCGYDHETDNGEMNRRELELRETLGI
jgi:probable rRNA maturation factor